MTKVLMEFTNFYDFYDQYLVSDEETRERLLQAYLEWQEQKGFPAICDDGHVIFIYYSNLGFTNSAQLVGDMNGWTPETMQMLPGADFFFLPYSLEDTARLDYKFVINGNWILDPRNDSQVPGGFGPNSELVMPKFQQPREIQYVPKIPHGTVDTLDTSFQSYNPRVQVYLPVGYHSSKRYPVVYFTDGSEYMSLGHAINTLDYLIAKNQIPPVIGIFIDPAAPTSYLV